MRTHDLQLLIALAPGILFACYALFTVMRDRRG